jgi:hypothetical protein
MRIDIGQRIGICYRDRKWAEDVLEQILNQTPKVMVARRMNNGIDFIDGSNIRLISATADNVRGYKLNKIFVQEGVDEEYINTCLKHCIIHKSILRETVLTPTSEVYFW